MTDPLIAEAKAELENSEKLSVSSSKSVFWVLAGFSATMLAHIVFQSLGIYLMKIVLQPEYTADYVPDLRPFLGVFWLPATQFIYMGPICLATQKNSLLRDGVVAGIAFTLTVSLAIFLAGILMVP